MNIFCIAKNYPEHIEEMARMERAADAPSLAPAAPVFFMKPTSALLEPHAAEGRSEPHTYALPLSTADGLPVLPLPADMGSIHHEVEVVVRLARRLRCAGPDEAADSVDAVTVGLDLTARDLQLEAKRAGRPWLAAKGFDASAIVGRWLPAHGLDLQALDFALAIDGRTAQHANTGQMITPIANQLAALSRHITLQPGDLLFTGTPSGVGPLAHGATLVATLNGAALLHIRVQQQP